jgi:16S rRNA C967 or C1407 C5-methylase (RsmB/RsmF family)
MDVKQEQDNYTTNKSNPLMQEYYRQVLDLSSSDFSSFWSILQSQLPVTFRVNPHHNNYKSLLSSISSSSSTTLKLEPIPWYPDNLVWQVNSNRSELRKQENVKEFHTFLQKANDSGLITRQELVSMLPPLVLQPQANEKVLDMCAAPGSKTAQLIELMGGSGMVVANDVDTNRAFMLIHQLHRSNTSSMVVVNHAAQCFPRIDFQFDKVLCDVPCSGDGAIRKIPSKWRKWKVKDGQDLHPLQINIFRRGAQLVRPGGFICYSTCSLNPIEDEAVVNVVAQEFDLEIIDLPELLARICPGLVFRPGQKTWKVLGNAKDKEINPFIEYSDFSQVPENIKSIRPSMFPSNVIPGLERTIRLYPHDQNTGGFYIGLFRKKVGIVRELEEFEEIKEQPVESNEKPKKRRKIIELDQPEFIPLEDGDDRENIVNVFGLPNHALDLLLTTKTKNLKNLFFVSPEVKEFLTRPESKVLKILNVGVCSFTKNKHKPSKALCSYRPHQDALPFISKFVFKNRLASENLDYLKTLLKTGFFESKEFKELTVGYYLMTFQSIGEEVLVLKVSEEKFQTVVPKEHIDSLYIRYPDLKITN